MAAIADPLVIETVLFEGGSFADFLVARRFLLHQEPLLLAQQWLLVGRSVYGCPERASRGRSCRLTRWVATSGVTRPAAAGSTR